MGFRENLKAELEYQGIKTKELAEKSGVNKRSIDHYLMSNPQEPSVSNAVKIAKALNVSVEYLVTGNHIISKAPQSQEIIDFINVFTSLTSEKRIALSQLATLLSK